MAWLRKTRLLPGSAPGGLEWHTEQDVVEVDDMLAAELLEIPDAGFVSVQAPEPEPSAKGEETGPDDKGAEPDPTADDGKGSEPKPARKTAASKTAASKTSVQE